MRAYLNSSRLRSIFALERLELRLALSVSNVHLETDSGYSTSDLLTNAGAIIGDISAPVSIDFDHNSDGIAEQRLDLMGSGFRYDPASVDSSLVSCERILPMRYRTIEVDELGNAGTPSAWTNFTYTLDNIAPQWAPLPTVTVQPNSSTTQINLNPYVQDGITTDSQLQISIVGNSNPALFSSAVVSMIHRLYLSYNQGQTGSALITIQATDRAGNSSLTNLTVHVSNAPPVITSFSYQEDAGRMFTFFGTVSDDANVAGLTVTLGGVLSQYNVSATVQTNGTFSVTTRIIGLPTGTATAVTQDMLGLSSNTASINVQPLFILGDMNGDGYLDAFDRQPLELALNDPSTYLAQYPFMNGIYSDVGDMNEDSEFDGVDLTVFDQLV